MHWSMTACPHPVPNPSDHKSAVPMHRPVVVADGPLLPARHVVADRPERGPAKRAGGR